MRTRLWLPVLFLLLASFVRLQRLESQSIWFDEGWSAYAANQPTLQSAIEADPTNPPLYYVLLNIAARGFGDSEFSLRYVSLLFALLAIPLAYQLGRRLFNPGAGLGAAFLVAWSPLMWWASQEARMYTLLALLVLLAALAWHQLLRSPARWAWLALWASELALLYAHNTGPVVVLWLNMITLFAWVGRRSFRQPDWRLWCAGQIVVAILWSPWFFTRFLLLPEANSALQTAPVLRLELLYQLWAALWMGSWTMVLQPEDLAPLYLVLLCLLLVACIFLIPWRKRAAYWLITHVVVLTAALIAGLGVLGNEMHGRYLVMIAPLFLVLVGAGLGAGIAWKGAARPQPINRILAYVSAILFLVTFIISREAVHQNPAYQHDDARGMVQYYARHLTENDTVLAWSYADRYELAYYWDRLGVRARRVTLPEGADLDRVLPLLPTSGDVALNIWYTQRADYRGMMSCLLANGTVNEPEVVAFYGMTNALYRAPSLNLPDLRPLNAAIDGFARLEQAGAIPVTAADSALCLPLQIELLAPTPADLKAALIVKNQLGWEIARDDAPFADAAQRTTALLQPGASAAAYPLLRLPYGTPPGSYEIFLRVYDEQIQLSGYDLSLSPDGRPVRDLPLGRWQVESGADWSQVNRSVELPVARDLPVGADLKLIADNIQGGTFRNGDQIRLALLWQGEGALPDFILAGENAAWSVNIPAPDLQRRDDIVLDWRVVQIPLDAPAGTAELRLPDGTPLGIYTIESLPAVYEAPEFDTPVNAVFPGVGTLVGYTLAADSLDRNQPFDVTLVWRADETDGVSYTVFVQLLNSDGQVIAQADAIPAGSTRPTNGWRPSEYILDQQRVTFHEGAQPGHARLIAGLYDAATGTRVVLTSGGDFVTLLDEVEVE